MFLQIINQFSQKRYSYPIQILNKMNSNKFNKKQIMKIKVVKNFIWITKNNIMNKSSNTNNKIKHKKQKNKILKIHMNFNDNKIFKKIHKF